MTKKNNANSARRKLIPAVGMLVVSAMMLSSSTYAWFSLSKDVTVSGMQIKATSEGGLLVINDTLEDTEANWGTSVSASYGISTPVTLLPTSTSNASNWYYATSQHFDNADAHQTAQNAYTEVSSANGWAVANGVATATGYSNGFYLVNNFWIKSSGAAITNNDLQIQDIDVSNVTDGRVLDKALRVAVVFNKGDASGTNNTFIYNPLNGDSTYYVNGTSFTVTDMPNPEAQTPAATSSGITSIPSSDAKKAAGNGETQAIKASVYLYFEGEDKDCKSSNLTTTLDNLSVSIKFGLAGAAGAQYGNSGTPEAPAASTPTGTYTITRTGTEGSYTYNYTKADGATFPTTGAYTWTLNNGEPGTYETFQAALAAAEWSDGNMTVTVAASN